MVPAITIPLGHALDMQILRTYALYGKSKKVAALIFIVGVVLVGLSIVSHYPLFIMLVFSLECCSGQSPVKRRAFRFNKVVTLPLPRHRELLYDL
jgi:hypothetical protein